MSRQPREHTPRCAFCGASQPGEAHDDGRCTECGQALRLATAPVARGPRGLCSQHPGEAVTGVCSRCGRFTCARCDVSVGGLRYCEGCREVRRQHLTAPVAWEERRHLGRLRAWWRTVAAVGAQPGAFFGQMRPDEGLAAAMGFGLLSCLVLVGPNMLWDLVRATLGLVMTAPVLVTGGSSGIAHGDISMIVALYGARGLMAALSPLAMFTLYLGVACGQHLALRIVHAGAEYGLSATLKVACYSMGVSWVGLVLEPGYLLAFPAWWTVLMVIGTARVHHRSTTRTLVVALPTLMLCLAPLFACTAAMVLGLFSAL